MPLLRLLVWNCSGRLHDKLSDLHDLEPDVAVLAECACPEVLLRRIRPGDLDARDLLWDGTHPSRRPPGRHVRVLGRALSPTHRPRCASTLPVLLSGTGCPPPDRGVGAPAQAGRRLPQRSRAAP
jgi:hypothetical protein